MSLVRRWGSHCQFHTSFSGLSSLSLIHDHEFTHTPHYREQTASTAIQILNSPLSSTQLNSTHSLKPKSFYHQFLSLSLFFFKGKINYAELVMGLESIYSKKYELSLCEGENDIPPIGL